MSTIPDGAKKPSDRKKKAKTSGQAEAQGVAVEFSHRGVDYIIERAVIEDVELLELATELDENASPQELIPFIKRLLGPAQWQRFKDASRDEHGRVPQSALGELFDAASESAGKSAGSP